MHACERVRVRVHVPVQESTSAGRPSGTGPEAGRRQGGGRAPAEDSHARWQAQPGLGQGGAEGRRARGPPYGGSGPAVGLRKREAAVTLAGDGHVQGGRCRPVA